MRLSFVLSLLLALTTFSPQSMAADGTAHKPSYPGCSTVNDCKCDDCTWSEKQQCCFSNPAATKCVEDGGWYFETHDGEKLFGNDNTAICYFEDTGKACNQWYYAHNLCQKGSGVELHPELKPGSIKTTITPDEYCKLLLGVVADAGKECKHFRPSVGVSQRVSCTVKNLWDKGNACAAAAE